tara:strand:- start:1550 stop:1699 length:150 start_codon:yes stop_codon:yes gene_type:complete
MHKRPIIDKQTDIIKLIGKTIEKCDDLKEELSKMTDLLLDMEGNKKKTI